MKGFVYILIVLLIALFLNSLLSKLGLKEGMECEPKENSISYSNKAKASSIDNQIAAMNIQLTGMNSQIITLGNQVDQHTAKINSVVQKVNGAAKKHEAKLDKAASQLK